MPKTDRCVVRNQAYRRGEFNLRERHNERKNEHYGNGDILPERTHLNVQFKSCDGTYEREFNRLVEEKVISLRGLKQDARVFDELVFDVNTAYFDDHGGYDYAKKFFEEAYRLAVEEAGGEQYILSAVMHADERNRALSEKLGRDVFHYHLHVVYVPVVEKEVRWTKRCKDPALVGTVKEVIIQVSHSKKWPRTKDENGRWINAYSLLQDRFHEHMRAAGFTDFERGERGSTAEHLDTLEYKIQQDEARAAASEAKAKKKQSQLEKLDEKLTVTKQAAVTFMEIDNMARKTIGGNVQLTPADWKTVSGLAKEGIQSRGIIKGLKEKLSQGQRQIKDLKERLARLGDGLSIPDTFEYNRARQRAPRRLAQVIADIFRQPPEKPEPTPTAEQSRKRSQTR
ncbi:MAG: plasmid recombination protein [Oscillospiraceae bacterium]|nr:plasmid recombination protein [Oscillospiraceae bacterium]